MEYARSFQHLSHLDHREHLQFCQESESSDRVAKAAHGLVLKVLLHEEVSVDELGCLEPVAVAVWTHLDYLLHRIGDENGAVRTQDHHCGQLIHIEHGLQLPVGKHTLVEA
ncbi:hypothetical protein CRENBAI_003649 [Crenichthys baileyi]|uniref:Uncharacterized protein n=1 Tax=Crenichthys baileyi TaxID=28760 RepID=A0AAV9RGY4_9TELE